MKAPWRAFVNTGPAEQHPGFSPSSIQGMPGIMVVLLFKLGDGGRPVVLSEAVVLCSSSVLRCWLIFTGVNNTARKNWLSEAISTKPPSRKADTSEFFAMLTWGGDVCGISYGLCSVRLQGGFPWCLIDLIYLGFRTNKSIQIVITACLWLFILFDYKFVEQSRHKLIIHVSIKSFYDPVRPNCLPTFPTVRFILFNSTLKAWKECVFSVQTMALTSVKL